MRISAEHGAAFAAQAIANHIAPKPDEEAIGWSDTKGPRRRASWVEGKCMLICQLVILAINFKTRVFHYARNAT